MGGAMRPYRFEVIEMANSDGFARVHVGDMRASFDRYNSELRKMHRRLWEARKRAVLAELSVANMEATDMHQCEFGTSKDAERAKVALRRFWKVSRMEYKP